MSSHYASCTSSDRPCVSSHPEKQRPFAGRSLWIAFVLLIFGLSLTACGPERDKSGSAALAEETVRIAREFGRNNDAGQARADLQALEVANPLQWLVYLAETAVSSGVDAEETADLVRLAVALGSQSQPILDYAVESGMIEADSVAANDDVVEAAQAAQPEAAAAEPVALPTVAVVALEPTPTPEMVVLEPTPTLEALVLEPTPTPLAGPRAVAMAAINVRSGPGTAYPIVEDLQTGEEAEIVGKNPQADWWQVSSAGGQVGWVFGQLVSTTGDVGNVAVAANIPEPPPTPTPAPVAAAPAEQPPAENPAPAEEAPAENPAPPADGPDFVVIEKRLWDVYENGGSLNGPSVVCGEKRQLVVNVVDANGSRINGVAVQAEFGAKEIYVTGAQGKGDGVVEFVLGRGQDVRVIRDADGREVDSEVARGMSTEPAAIPYETLIAGQYCSDDASCKAFVDMPGCWGHYSWTVTFQRKY